MLKINVAFKYIAMRGLYMDIPHQAQLRMSLILFPYIYTHTYKYYLFGWLQEINIKRWDSRAPVRHHLCESVFPCRLQVPSLFLILYLSPLFSILYLYFYLIIL